MILRVKVKPNAKTVSVEQLEDKSLKISIKSPPVNGKANEELIKVLSEFLKVSKSKINIKAGKSSREKLVEIYD
ncbi:protein of unknown function DUF167 [Hydrogenobaculum sp. Y04AAS1]|uniref:UPF0235 protein HY04AAS1_1378 n=1 Tax=Hydrogenobaculum sp. (strain Y04AAS1) TaxID=380749 RepID=Y1378_HYDS0|nr:RecName: Full=UPF0235 protein HY04AAS1_1378 [Hydrogenobaculum sp. Y04AAS1]ACG58063.1 protein of unknown function DUF167 [Hydrogenobaculum sp. Y04AAS1]HCT66074.1 YggU family protein [Hydrogenobaculum sp.]